MEIQEGDNEEWKQPEFDDSDWEAVNIPANWEDHSDYTKNDAFGWCRRTIEIPSEWKGYDLLLTAGKIDDGDWTYFNGKQIGSTKG